MERTARTAFLSFRAPVTMRNRIKEIAAREGVSVQKLMNALVGNFLQQQRRSPPALASVITVLRENRDHLRRQGIDHLYVCGSVARGEASADSDVDLAADFDPASTPSLVLFSSIKAGLEEIIGQSVDLADRAALDADVHRNLDHDAVQIF